MRVPLAVLVLILLVACLFGCGDKDRDGAGRNSPAGHPDELRDSTRFDPAQDSFKMSGSEGGKDSTSDARHRLRFR